MPLLTRLNRILLVWLLVVAGAGLGPARGLAACDMDAKAQASGHACCIKKAACVCDAAKSAIHRDAAHPGARQAACSCAARPRPASSAPKFEPLREYVVAALPSRAGPAIALCAAAVSPVFSEPAACCSDCISSSSPRAPPFRA